MNIFSFLTLVLLASFILAYTYTREMKVAISVKSVLQTSASVFSLLLLVNAALIFLADLSSPMAETSLVTAIFSALILGLSSGILISH